MEDMSTTFADMKDYRYDYQDEDIRFVTAFEELAGMDTSQLDGYMILACNGGKMDVDVNGSRVHLNTWEALILPPHTRLANYMVSPGIRCDLMLINAYTLRSLLGEHIGEWDKAVYIDKTNHIITDDESRQRFVGYVKLLELKLTQTDKRYSREIIRSIVRSILFDYLELMVAATPAEILPSGVGRRKVLFRQFIELLSTRRVKHQLVDTYAQELCVSPSYLTKTCKELSDKTAQQWIREYTEQDIRYHRANSDSSIKEICEELGFPDLSFFAKFCRRAFGCPPTEYRKRLKAAKEANEEA